MELLNVSAGAARSCFRSNSLQADVNFWCTYAEGSNPRRPACEIGRQLKANNFTKGQSVGGRLRRTNVNGQPGAMFLDSRDRFIAVIELDIADGVVQSIRSVVNLDKLQHLGPVSDFLQCYNAEKN
jgi:hypothetical protein